MGFIPQFSYYDFHIYYQAHQAVSRDRAVALRDKIKAEFASEQEQGRLVVKQLRDQVVGPHVTNFFEIDIQDPELFGFFFSWVTVHRDGLDILVHPHSGNGYKDHFQYPIWIGEKLPLIDGILKDKEAPISPFGLPTRQINELKALNLG